MKPPTHKIQRSVFDTLSNADRCDLRRAILNHVEPEHRENCLLVFEAGNTRSSEVDEAAAAQQTNGEARPLVLGASAQYETGGSPEPGITDAIRLLDTIV